MVETWIPMPEANVLTTAPICIVFEISGKQSCYICIHTDWDWARTTPCTMVAFRIWAALRLPSCAVRFTSTAWRRSVKSSNSFRCGKAFANNSCMSPSARGLPEWQIPSPNMVSIGYHLVLAYNRMMCQENYFPFLIAAFDGYVRCIANCWTAGMANEVPHMF